MRAVVQRVSRAQVSVGESITGSISGGLVVLLGIQASDREDAARWLAEKIVNLRVFEDDEGKMNRSLIDTGGHMLVVSQFTLYGDCRKGRRPGYSNAAPPDKAEPLYEIFIEYVRERGIQTATGTFQAMMELSLTNHGPVTLLLDSDKTF